MKNKTIKYLLYHIFLHSSCIFMIYSSCRFPAWGDWLINTRFLNYSFSLYIAMIIGIFPLFSILPYYYQHDFPHVSGRKKITLAALLIGNTLLILTYSAFIHTYLPNHLIHKNVLNDSSAYMMEFNEEEQRKFNEKMQSQLSDTTDKESLVSNH